MTLEEAIKHCEEVASRCEFDTDWGMGNHFIDRSGVADEIECGKEHRQLAEWLKDYKRLLEQEPCEDCISRQDAIFLANDLKQDMPDDERIADMVMAHNEGILEYQTQLSLLPSVTPQPKAKWIPVSERLPEICEEDCHGNITFSKRVLTTQIYGDGYVNVGIDKYTTNNGGGWLTEVPFDNPEECCEVIAWMPLPEPYEELKRNSKGTQKELKNAKYKAESEVQDADSD